MKHMIEVFSAGCPMCSDTIDLVKKLAGSEREVHVRDMQEADAVKRAKDLGIRSLPAVVIDGAVATCCAGRGPDAEVLGQALR